MADADVTLGLKVTADISEATRMLEGLRGKAGSIGGAGGIGGTRDVSGVGATSAARRGISEMAVEVTRLNESRRNLQARNLTVIQSEKSLATAYERLRKRSSEVTQAEQLYQDALKIRAGLTKESTQAERNAAAETVRRAKAEKELAVARAQYTRAEVRQGEKVVAQRKKELERKKEMEQKEGQMIARAKQEMMRDLARREAIEQKKGQMIARAKQEMERDFARRRALRARELREEQRMLALHIRALKEYAKARMSMGVQGVARNILGGIGRVYGKIQGMFSFGLRTYWVFLSIMYAIRNIIRPFTRMVETMVEGFRKIIGLAVQFVKSVVNAASEMEILEKRMGALFGMGMGAEGRKMMGEDALQYAMNMSVGIKAVWTDIAEAMIKGWALGSEIIPKAFPEKGIKGVIPAALDLAAVFGRTAEEAAEAIMKGATGWFRSLRASFGILPSQVLRYGGVPGRRPGTLAGAEAGPEAHARNLLAIISLIEDRYGGMARAMAYTFAAALADVQDMWAHFAYALQRRGFLKPLADAIFKVRDRFFELTEEGYKLKKEGILDYIAWQFTQWSERLRPVWNWLADRVEPILIVVSGWLDKIGIAFDEWYARSGGIEGIMTKVMGVVVDWAPHVIAFFRTYLQLVLSLGDALLWVFEQALYMAMAAAALLGKPKAVKAIGAAYTAVIATKKEALPWLMEKEEAIGGGIQERVTISAAARQDVLARGGTAEQSLQAAQAVLLNSEAFEAWKEYLGPQALGQEVGPVPMAGRSEAVRAAQARVKEFERIASKGAAAEGVAGGEGEQKGIFRKLWEVLGRLVDVLGKLNTTLKWLGYALVILQGISMMGKVGRGLKTIKDIGLWLFGRAAGGSYGFIPPGTGAAATGWGGRIAGWGGRIAGWGGRIAGWGAGAVGGLGLSGLGTMSAGAAISAAPLAVTGLALAAGAGGYGIGYAARRYIPGFESWLEELGDALGSWYSQMVYGMPPPPRLEIKVVPTDGLNAQIRQMDSPGYYSRYGRQAGRS